MRMLYFAVRTSQMAAALPLKAALKRGFLITLANWPVVVIEFTIGALFRAALAVPVLAGAVMVAAMIGGDVRALVAEGLRAAADVILATLATSPLALAAFLAAVAIVAFGGVIILYVVKTGTLSVLVAADRQTGDVDREPIGTETIERAQAYHLAPLLANTGKFSRRAVKLACAFSVAYGLVAVAYLFAIRYGIVLTERSPWTAWWPLLVVIATTTSALAVTALNLAYDLLRVIIVTDDCGVRDAIRRLRRFVIEDARQVVGIFGVMWCILTLMTAFSLVAAAGVALVAWMPVIGLIVVPLQGAAWLLRGLLGQGLELAAVAAYQTQYRRFAEPSWPAAVPKHAELA